jgi:MFS family permease
MSGSSAPDTAATVAETESLSVANAFPWRFVAPLLMGSTLNPINSSVIATALIAIAAATGVSPGRTAILISSLYLACSVAQPTAGKLSEEFGPRRVFLTGTLLVFGAGIVGGFAQSLTALVVARVLIGIGTSTAYPSAMVLIRRRAQAAGLLAPPGNVLGGLAIAGQATVAIGPAIGGLLLAAFGWRSAFLLNVPLALPAIAMAAFWIPKDPPRAVSAPREVAARIDALGILGFAATMVTLLIFVMGLPHAHWAFLAVALVLAVIFVFWELRTRTPFIDLRLLAANPPLTRTYLRMGLSLMALYLILYGFTQWLEAARGFSADAAGLLLIPMGAVATVVSRPIASRNLVRGPLIIAAFSTLLAAILTLFLTTHSPVTAILGVTILFGISTGAVSVSNQTALYAQAPAETVGTAAGLLRTFGYVGSIASAAIIGITFHTHVTDTGLHHISVIMIGLGIVLVAMTVLDRSLESRSE